MTADVAADYARLVDLSQEREADRLIAAIENAPTYERFADALTDALTYAMSLSDRRHLSAGALPLLRRIDAAARAWQSNTHREALAVLAADLTGP